MKTYLASLFAILSIAFVVGKHLKAADLGETPAPPAAQESPAANAPIKLLYKPPAGAGNIPTRISGGARGENGVDTALFALVPDHLALTTQAQPSLFWFQSKPSKAKFELTVVEPKKPKPLLSLTSPDADKPGIHRIKLARYKV